MFDLYLNISLQDFLNVKTYFLFLSSKCVGLGAKQNKIKEWKFQAEH